jgi:hypothetical protein
MLWYACYEIVAGRLSYVGYNLYLFCRFFRAPVFRPAEFCIDWDSRRRWQWRGVGALAIAFVALGFKHILKGYLNGTPSPWITASGGQLIWYSYCSYLLMCFTLVAGFNMFIGWARLFGIPVKNTFYFWLLSRTPNERWQRWNILFREWIITYVFYPMMRAKRGLFLSIMVTLMMSGVIHLLDSLTPERFDLGKIARVMSYWTVNGLAIYLVIVIPRKFPGLLDRLKMRESVLWSAAGIVITSAFYSVLTAVRDQCLTFDDASGYLQRLVLM